MDQTYTVKSDQTNQIINSRIYFTYEIYNEAEELICKGNTTLVFVKKETMRPTEVPVNLLEKLN